MNLIAWYLLAGVIFTTVISLGGRQILDRSRPHEQVGVIIMMSVLWPFFLLAGIRILIDVMRGR